MADLSINSNTPEPIDNNKNSVGNKQKTVTRWSNSIYTWIENGNGKVDINDLQNEQNRGKEVSKAAKEIFNLINDFFEKNNGKDWTEKSINDINRLLQAFNIKNKTDDCKTEEYYNEDGKITGFTHYDSDNTVKETGEFTYDTDGNPLLFSNKDANGNITYESYYEKQENGEYKEINITQYD